MASVPPADGTEIDVSVCIVNWNGREMLRDCLISLCRRPQGARLEVVVVDNGSADGAADMVADGFPDVTLIRNADNRGFARANNQAAARARGRYLFFLNNDTLVPPGTLGRLVAFAEAHPEVGMIGPRLRGDDGEVQASYRPQPSLGALLHRTMLWRYTGLFRRAYRRYRRERFDPDRQRPVETLMGAALFLPRRVFLECGPWDEDFLFGGEDLQLSAAVGRRYPLVFLPEVEIVHYGGVATRQHMDYVAAARASGFARFLRKSGYSRPALLAYKAAITLDLPVQFIVRGLQYLGRRMRRRPAKAQKTLLAWRGAHHFLVHGLVPFWKA
jgi:GT2 family glycosyltransferase